MMEMLDTFADLMLLAGFCLPYLFFAGGVGTSVYAVWAKGHNGKRLGLAFRIFATLFMLAFWALILWSGWVSGRLPFGP